MTISEESSPPAIVFYDGECGLCTCSVRFLLARDRRGRLRFAPLQGTTAEQRLSVSERESLGTVVLLEGERASRRSTAILRALRHCGGGLGLLARIGLWIPRPLRDGLYRCVAARRSRFGRASALGGGLEEGRLLP